MPFAWLDYPSTERIWFGVDLMLKDLGLAMEAALLGKVPTPLGAAARNLYHLHSQAGNGRLDFSSIIRLLHPE